jgi:hypothetical protein
MFGEEYALRDFVFWDLFSSLNIEFIGCEFAGYLYLFKTVKMSLLFTTLDSVTGISLIISAHFIYVIPFACLWKEVGIEKPHFCVAYVSFHVCT